MRAVASAKAGFFGGRADAHVYILRSKSDPAKTYIGCTGDLPSRLLAHNRGKCRYTSRYTPWEVVVSVSFPDDAKAYEFERYRKSGSGRAFAKRHFH